ncbi:hypothetical protein BDF20DRAFT_878014 [Mycotypha africana]|uniref:uncharacterized protein n=1 Tax=Mycotypha africana TaxID=64632 RepID=UPI002301ACB5|nr:uncharacterized protein BDF20DRAFT_878014 [Mycotypha africana]KAI8975329.1 hypothetical protein BDF20DRAFT_878014 [Mycotypha africana]
MHKQRKGNETSIPWNVFALLSQPNCALRLVVLLVAHYESCSCSNIFVAIPLFVPPLTNLIVAKVLYVRSRKVRR